MVELTHRNDTPAFADIRLESDDIIVRKLRLRDLWQSLREGYDDYLAKPSSIPFLMLYYPLFALVFTLLSFGQDLRYLAFPIVAGFTLVGPIVAIAFFAMSQRREQGKELRWGAAFGFIHSHSFAPILALSLFMMLLYVAWLYMAELIYFGLFTENPPESMAALIDEVLSTRRGFGLIAYGHLVGFLFACAALAVSVVAFPLILDKPVTSITAVSVSASVFMENTFVLLVWGLIVTVLMALGAAVFFIGLAVVLPVLGHATWHLYRKAVVR